MTGPEHYHEAERLIEGPDRDRYTWDEEGEAGYERDRRDNLAEAQIHATLALAAASASYGMNRTPEGHDAAWTGVIA